MRLQEDGNRNTTGGVDEIWVVLFCRGAAQKVAVNRLMRETAVPLGPPFSLECKDLEHNPISLDHFALPHRLTDVMPGLVPGIHEPVEL